MFNRKTKKPESELPKPFTAWAIFNAKKGTMHSRLYTTVQSAFDSSLMKIKIPGDCVVRVLVTTVDVETVNPIEDSPLR
jgi:hypothetical protein